MQKIKREELFPLEKYTALREGIRAEIMAHKKNRRLAVGPNLTLYFENRSTIHYQIQEMLRIEKIFEAEDIEEELKAYNPLIPDGKNLKATMMVEFPDAVERARELAKMLHIENQIWLKVDGHEPVYPVADEDLDRTTDDKTSAVHFLRFELTDEMIASLQNGAALHAGVEHDAYTHRVEPVPNNIRESLLKDFD